MLFIETNKKEYTWHVGYQLPELGEDESVNLIQADGHELAFVLEKFRNLPYTNRSVIVWTGDNARFIYNNLESAP